MAASDFVPIAQSLRVMAQTQPDMLATAVATARGFSEVRYSQLNERSEAMAAGLVDAGLGPQVKVAMMVPPSDDFFALAFALLKAGAVPVLIDPGIGLSPLKTCLEEAQVQGFIGIPKAHLARAVLGWCPGAKVSVTVGAPALWGRSLSTLEKVGRARIARGEWKAPQVDADALAAVLFTSGSTGIPKGVEYLHRHFRAQAELLRSTYAIEPGETNLATFPPFALFGPALGMTTVVPRMDPTKPARVKPPRIATAAAEYQATMMFGSPALLDTVSRWGELTGGKLPSIRKVMSAGAPVSPRIMKRMLAMLPDGAEIFTPYGATESLPVASISSTEVLALQQERTGICVGRPVAQVDVGIVRISDEPLPSLVDADFLPAGEVGEIVVRGPNVTLAYHLRPEATALAKTTWGEKIAHRMGDLGWFDDAGRLWFAGRKAHRVETAQGPLYSVCVEEVFNTHSKVYRTALVGIGLKGAQEPVLCVEPEPGVRGDEALAQELLTHGRLDPLGTGASRVTKVLFHPAFPVDIRHNSKIGREKLSVWAAERLAR